MRLLKTARLVALASLLALPAACGPFRRGETGEAAGQLAARIYFNNESLDQAAVYAVGPGSDQVRIGTVMAGRTDTLVVPSSLVGSTSLRIYARPLGRSIMPSSGTVTLQPGEALSITLPSDQRTLVVLPPRER
jgi:hypothetical protein